MSLSAQLKTPPAHNYPGPECSVGKVLNVLKGAERAALQAMLASDEWTGVAIENALTAEGYTARKDKINKHRRGCCRCDK